VILILLCVGTVSLALHLGLKRVLIEAIFNLENDSAQTDIGRVQNGLKSKEEFLLGKIGDWARWDDTHEFVNGKRPQYVHENFRKPEEFFANLKIDYIAIFNDKRSLLFAMSFDFEKNEVTKKVDDYIEFFKTLELGKTHQGFFKVGDSILHLVALPIVNSDLTSNPTGHFISGYFVDSAYFEKISGLMQLNLTATPPWGTSTPKFDRINDSQIQLKIPLLDTTQREILGIQVLTARTTFQVFLGALQKMNIVIGLTSLVLAVLGYLGVEWLIVKRLKRLGAFLASIEISKLNEKILYKDTQKDEIGTIAVAANSLIDKVVEDKRFIAKQSTVLIHSERLKAIGEMAGGIAHEINNPLAIISGRTKQLTREALKNPVDPQKIKELDEKIESTIGRVSTIIRGLRASVRQSDNEEIIKFDLNQMLEETLEMCRPKASLNEISLQLSANSTVQLKIEGQRVAISQVVINLVSNALDEVSKLSDEKWVQIETEFHNDQVKIFVRDSGKGIPSEVLPKLFQPFFTTKEIGKGTGLGLSISKGIVEAHKGNLFVDPDQKNTCFVIELPLRHTQNLAA
jgi:signal transduction histidine kinase